MLEQGVDALGQLRSCHGLALQALARLHEPVQFLGLISPLTGRCSSALSGHRWHQRVHDVADRVAVAQWIAVYPPRVPDDDAGAAAHVLVLAEVGVLQSKVFGGNWPFVLELLRDHRETLDTSEASGLVAGEDVVHQIGEGAQRVLQLFGVHASPTIAAAIVLATARTTLTNNRSLTRCSNGSSS